MGRTILLCVPLIVGVAFYYGLRLPYGGLTETTAVLVFGILFVFMGMRGFIAIRARRIDEHREWMTRLFGIGLGIAIQRVLGTPIVLFVRVPVSVWFGASTWAGFILGAVGAEWLIRRRRRSAPTDQPPVEFGGGAEDVRRIEPPLVSAALVP